MEDKLFWKVTLATLVIIFVLGGFGIKVELVQYFGVLIGALLIILIWLQKRKIILPKYIIPYSLFLILFLLHTFSVSVNLKKSLEVFSLFLSGGLFWVVTYNHRKELSPYFDKLILFLGIFFAGLYFGNTFFGDPDLVRPWSLFANYSAYKNHNNIGDFWAVVLTVVIYYLSKNPRNIYFWLMTFLGGYLLYISQSRAAYVALAAGVIFLANAKGWVAKYKRITSLFLIVAIFLFLIIGTQKTTIFTRQYYVQGILGFIHNPQGVGVGNFDVISSSPENHIFGLTHFSSVAHNLPLEIVSGMGILGVVFIYWLFRVVREIWESENKQTLIYRAVFLTLFVNFFFHSSYFIPTMFWMWFIALGLAQNSKQRIYF